LKEKGFWMIKKELCFGSIEGDGNENFNELMMQGNV
jgi:hypothetical protein